MPLIESKKNKIKLVQGSDKTFKISAMNPQTKQIEDLTQATNITISFKKKDGTTFTSTTSNGVSIGSNPNSYFLVNLKGTDTQNFYIGEDQDIGIQFDLNNIHQVYVLREVLEVQNNPFI